MKIKIPKTITVCSTTFKIKQRNDDQARFSYDKSCIEIGTRYLKTDPTRVLELIIHELTEIIHIELYTRYQTNDDLRFEFHYTHRQHTTACAMLAGLLTRFIK